jgi:heptosyltransferase-2
MFFIDKNIDKQSRVQLQTGGDKGDSMKRVVTSILIIKLGALGDIVLASALLPAIRKRYPAASIAWVVGGQAVDILSSLDASLEIVVVNEKALFSSNLWKKIKEILRIAMYFRFRRFSIVLIPYFSRKYLVLRLGVLADKTRAFWQKRGSVPGRYRAVNYIQLLDDKDGSIDAPGDFSPGVCFAPLRKLPIPVEIVPDILLVPGGAKNLLADDKLRRWPVLHYAELADMLLGMKYSVGIVGGPDDIWVKKYFSALPVLDFVDKFSLRSVLGLLKRVRILVTHDTGMMHMMALANGKIVALFGPTGPAEFAPPHHAVTVQAPGFLPCRPCYDGKRYAVDCDVPLCMERITPQMVFDATAKQLSS